MREGKSVVAEIMNRLYARGLTTVSGGNVSARAGDAILITPSATDKGRMRPEEIAEIALDGVNRTPHLKPSIETSMHLSVYRKNPNVEAIVHAHPPFATAFAAAGRLPNVRLTAEGYAILGEPALAPYALMGSPELAEIVADTLSGGRVCALMESHGAICVGATLLEAFDRIEVLENAARIELYVERLGGAEGLSPARCEAIDRLMGRGGGAG